jgi:hypothetical protein
LVFFGGGGGGLFGACWGVGPQVNVWWSGARPGLTQALPPAQVPYALRLLAHRAAELRLAEWTEAQVGARGSAGNERVKKGSCTPCFPRSEKKHHRR